MATSEKSFVQHAGSEDFQVLSHAKVACSSKVQRSKPLASPSLAAIKCSKALWWGGISWAQPRKLRIAWG